MGTLKINGKIQFKPGDRFKVIQPPTSNTYYLIESVSEKNGITNIVWDCYGRVDANGNPQPYFMKRVTSICIEEWINDKRLVKL